jgi:hypothetical protein
MWCHHVQYMLLYISYVPYMTLHISYVQYMGLEWMQISMKRVRSEQDGREANNKHRGVPRSDLGRFRSVESEKQSIMVHRNKKIM